MLTLFHREVADIAALLLSQHVIYVGGGNTANMLAIWRLHGVDVVLREAWSRGIVLAGASAGAELLVRRLLDRLLRRPAGTAERRARPPCRQLLPALRRRVLRQPSIERWVAEGVLPPGYAADDGVGLVFRGTELAEAVSEADGGRAFRVEADGAQPLAVRSL